MREFSLLFAPNINSYKRYQPGSFAPTAVRWGVDNRTCALRIAGHGEGMRVENRVPGGDVNPYLAISALIAGALHGIENELSLEDEFAGNAYLDADAPRVPGRCATRPPSGRTAASRKRHSGPKSSPITRTWRRWNWPLTTRRSPTGSCAADSNVSEGMIKS